MGSFLEGLGFGVRAGAFLTPDAQPAAQRGSGVLATGKKDESVKQPCKPQPEVCACLSARLFRAGGAGRRGRSGDGAESLAPLLLCQPQERR